MVMNGRLERLVARQNLLTPGTGNASFVDKILTAMTAAASRAQPSQAAGNLSEREAEVLQYLPTMLTAGEIAAELGVSVNTVKAHLRSIYRKLDAARRREAVLRAHEFGLL
jgi:LuxR family transcriptional regulator, maltose regulon positive regulatory protein